MKLGDVRFLEVDDVERAHAVALARDGGMEGVRDAGALDGAVMAPRATFGGEPLYPSLAAMAATYAYGIGRAHVFVDGNKRTALAAALLFLRLHGHALKLGPEWVDFIVRMVEEPRFSREELAERFAAEMGGDTMIEAD